MYFIDRMDMAYSAADIIVSRAGAISVSELCIIGKPSVLIPSPNVAEDHQTKNALALVKSDAAILIKDSDCMSVLGKTVTELLSDNSKCRMLSDNIKTLALPHAADAIADEVMALVKRK